MTMSDIRNFLLEISITENFIQNVFEQQILKVPAGLSEDDGALALAQGMHQFLVETAEELGRQTDAEFGTDWRNQ